MRLEIPHPCSGSRAIVFRMSRSSVPCSRSDGFGTSHLDYRHMIPRLSTGSNTGTWDRWADRLGGLTTAGRTKFDEITVRLKPDNYCSCITAVALRCRPPDPPELLDLPDPCLTCRTCLTPA